MIWVIFMTHAMEWGITLVLTHSWWSVDVGRFVWPVQNLKFFLIFLYWHKPLEKSVRQNPKPENRHFQIQWVACQQMSVTFLFYRMAICWVDFWCPMLFSPEYQVEHHRKDFQRGDLAQSMERPVWPKRPFTLIHGQPLQRSSERSQWKIFSSPQT